MSNSQRLYTAAQVRALDAEAIEGRGIPGYQLMCRAGQATAESTAGHWPDANHWLVLCGGGNNGGDGYVIAREARQMGRNVTVIALTPVESLSGDAAQAARDWLEAGGEVQGWPTALPAQVDVALDALLGTGLDREVGGAYLEVIEKVNSLDCLRVAVDIPSGLHADTGQVMGMAFRADMTVTFIGRKRGLYTADGPDHAGMVIFDDLDTPPDIDDSIPDSGWLDDARFPLTHLLSRRANSHKGSYGHALVVAGNAGMSGAARLCGEAALRSGCGLVTVATHPAHALWLNLPRPELMVTSAATADDLDEVVDRASVIAVGPGLGQDDWARGLLERCLAASQPLVVDADGLNLLADQPARRGNWVLTPHPAEAARLLSMATPEVQADRFAAATQLAERFRAVVVLKGCGTVIASPEGQWAVCSLGNPGMATAGSGDVLTGVVAAMLAQGLEPWVAARAAVTAHAAAGDLCALQGQRGMLATEIAACLPAVLNEWEEE